MSNDGYLKIFGSESWCHAWLAACDCLLSFDSLFGIFQCDDFKAEGSATKFLSGGLFPCKLVPDQFFFSYMRPLNI